MGGACSTYGVEEKCMQGLVRKPERKIPLGRLKRRSESIRPGLEQEEGRKTG
jgi:hypothetical protein